MKGTFALNRQEKRLWISNHAEEIARARNHGLSVAELATKFRTTEYYVYVALFVTGDFELPKSNAASIRKQFGSLKANFRRRHINMSHRPALCHTPTKDTREGMVASALEQADSILADYKADMGTCALSKKYQLSSYYIYGALFHRGINKGGKDHYYATWPKVLAKPMADPRSVQAAKVAVINKAWEARPSPKYSGLPRSVNKVVGELVEACIGKKPRATKKSTSRCWQTSKRM